MSNPVMFDRFEELELERDHLEYKIYEASKVDNTAEISEEEVRSILEKQKNGFAPRTFQKSNDSFTSISTK